MMGLGLRAIVPVGFLDWLNYFRIFFKKCLRGVEGVAIVRPLLTRHTKRS